MSDEELLEIWQQNSEEGFRLVYERYADVLLRFVFRFTGNQEQAEEILQDLFTELLKVRMDSRDFQLKADSR